MSRQRSYYEASSKIIPFRYETDVWSFGVLAWEIFTLGRVPYHDFQTNAEVMKAVVEHRARLEQPFRCPNELYSILKRCWEYEAADRPKFRDIYCEMKELYNLTSTDDTESLASLAIDARAEHKDPYFRYVVTGSIYTEQVAPYEDYHELKIGRVAPVDFRPHTRSCHHASIEHNTPSNTMNGGSYSKRYYLLCLSRLDVPHHTSSHRSQVMQKWLTVLFCVVTVTSLYVHEGSSTRYINSFPTSDFGSLPWPQSLDNLTLYFAPNGGCFIPQTFTRPTAVLAVRGNCTFVWKFKTAQSAGAQAFILMNRMPWAGEDQKVPIGSGGPDPSNITIPSVSLNYWEGQPLRDALLAGKQLTVTFNATRMADNQRIALLDIWKKIDPFDNWSKTSPLSLFEANSSLGDPCVTPWRDNSVICDMQGRVVVLQIPNPSLFYSGINFGGQLSTQLEHLTSLVILRFTQCKLSGTIPDVFYGMSQLASVHLDTNALTGNIPRSLVAVPSLYIITVKSNQLEGTLPAFNSTSLVTIQLRCEQHPPNLTSFSQNQLSGEIPQNYFQSPALQTISLASNNLCGQIPPLLANGQVAMLDLSNNFLNGTIEESIFEGITIATSINLGSNFLSGDIPYTLMTSSPTIRLDNNMFTRLDYINSTTIISLNVANNPLNSLFPQISAASLSILNMRNCGLRSPLPATVLASISYLDISFNPLDMDVSGISTIVASSSFYLRTILLKSCGITGTFSYFGSNLFVTLFKLDLSGNRLTGPFAMVNQVVNSIQYIDVSSNNLTGTLDESLAPASQLFFFNMSNNPHMRSYNGYSLPSWIEPDPRITVSQLAQHMSCPLLVRKDSPSSQIIVDPGYYNYSLCSCQEGYVVGDNGMCTNCPPSGICPDSEGGVDVINGTGYTCPENQFLQVRDGQVTCVPGNSNILSRGAIAGIVCGIVILLFTVAAAVTIFLLRRRRKRRERSADMAEMQRLNLSDLMLDNVTVQHIIGEGNFGAVYKGSWSDTDVALKGLHSTLDKSEDMRWREEIALLKGLNHPNVVRLLGVTMHDDRVLMVLEFVECGSLDNYLRKSHRELTDNNLISMCFDIVKGMIYLQSKGVIHRDLAARNMLIDGMKHVKISDFGMSRQRSYYEASSKIIPFRWSPPETIRSHVSSYETDVWSFGVLAWEIFTLGKVPYHDFQTNAEVMKAVVEHRARLEQPFRCPNELYSILKRCWEYEAADRPKFRDIYCEMKELYNLTSTDDTESLAPLAIDVESGRQDPYCRYVVTGTIYKEELAPYEHYQE
ncbi:fer (fps/fes related) tyrosine kinase (phosphoprotein NCP94) [Planoprotostelium fungivorum]|uniref:Fer (Fps/fes related) tyrosine kinase (Phosphoprotein NCP94) n=1 Tax=Planoprotostelium fungivorum TaxID=1890364 RepID=A0A2P6N4G7_9EUKA|nr:fer (fps/fes related) tyrosine kinase (phosphoprotein NCP94) [Planoprotostelium fungivorum]